ncbi:tetratricopeptide repeat protein [Occallatibacter savannae]|uniref:tetratricopeptide repeat protein n=1 Tax=Occallatibacter savannae TaxID=1002691 RepID=UPI0013A56CB4|nr:tetratricopeptide repeat protein [Occallatibacter savannae]
MAARCARTFTLLLLFLSVVGFEAAGQCASGASDASAVHALYSQQKWADVVAAAHGMPGRTADANFELGMALAHLQKWGESRAALLAGRRQCPKQARFDTELAGVAFQQKRYADAARWIRKAVRLDPRDEYANEFAGTVYLLMGNLEAALKYWNRIKKPQIEQLQFDVNVKTGRVLLERAFVFSPQAMMRRDQLLDTQARLNAMGVFPAYSIRLDAREGGKFDAQFHGMERNGFGNGWLQSVVSVFSGLPYETVYPSYFNLAGSATNIDSLVRWDGQKRRLWVSMSGPWHSLPQWRWEIAADGRDENWSIRRSFTGSAPELGAFKLKREVASANLTSITSGRMQWSSGAEVSHRTYTHVSSGTTLNGELASPGWEIKHLASVNARLLDVPEHRLTVGGSASSELGRLWQGRSRTFEKAQGGATLHWMPEAEGDKWEIAQRVRGGGIAGSAPFDELWMIGVERDNDLWLRGHIGTRGGKKGSAPMADRYFLSNTDVYRKVWGNGLVSIKAGPLLDIARAAGPTPELAPRKWLIDVGAEVKLSVLGTGVVLTYGRDLRSGSNAFYGSVAQP